MKSLIVFLLLLSSPALYASDLTETETRLATVIDRKLDASLVLLQHIVDLNSGTMNFEGVKTVGEAVAPAFEALGFATRWEDGADWGRAGHLIAEHTAENESARVLFIGHLDTVFEPDSPFQRFERVDEFAATGPGITDMKGGIVVMLLALNGLDETGALDKLSVTVVLTGDEEKSGTPLSLARRDLLAAAEWADIAIGFEDGDGDSKTAVIARRGSSGWTLRTSGRRAHSSQIFGENYGSGAIYECARILKAFHDTLGGERYLTFNPGVILGGTEVELEAAENRGSAFGKSNVIAGSAVVMGDLRALSLEQRERAKNAMIRIVADHYPHTDAEIVFKDSYPPLDATPGNRQALAMFDQASQDLGFGPVLPVDPAKAGAADVSFTAGLVDMAMDGVGLMGDGGHTLDEVADLRTLPIQAKRMALMMYRLAHDSR